jgi:vacuolar-type H+-ATPase subunit I/STV1
VSKESKYAWDRTELHASGILALQVLASFLQRECLEGKSSLTEQIPAMLDKLENLSQEISAERREWVRQREIRETEERARKDLEERREKELSDFKQLLREAERWQQANIIRQYVAAVEARGGEIGVVREGLGNWVIWAKAKADWYDPGIDAGDEWLEGVDKNTLSFNRRQS